MMTVIYSGSFNNLKDAVSKANSLLQDDSFYRLIAAKDGFDFTNATPKQISDAIKNCSLSTTVVTYTKWLPPNTLGYEDPQDPTRIHINMHGWRGNRSVASYVGTIIHEAVHCADSDNGTLNFGHNGNTSPGNENTAPYWIGNLAINIISNPLLTVADLSHLFAEYHALETEETLA